MPEERKAEAPACSHLLTPAAGFATFLPSDTKPEMQFAQQPASRWIYFNFLEGFVETFLHDLQIHAQQPAQMIFSRLLLSTIGDLQNYSTVVQA